MGNLGKIILIYFVWNNGVKLNPLFEFLHSFRS